MKPLLYSVVSAAALACTSSSASAASSEDCQAFHQECTDARAQGYRDAGICNVERLECRPDPRDTPDAANRRRNPTDAQRHERDDMQP